LNALIAGVTAGDRLFGNGVSGARLAEEFTIMHGARHSSADLAHDAMLIDDDLDLAGVAFLLAGVVLFLVCNILRSLHGLLRGIYEGKQVWIGAAGGGQVLTFATFGRRRPPQRAVTDLA
jgi:hypothetical protein